MFAEHHCVSFCGFQSGTRTKLHRKWHAGHLSRSIVLSCPIMSCLFLSHHVLSCLVVSCPVLSCLVLSCPVLSCLVVSCHVLSCLVLSYLVLSCPVMYVLSCLVLSCLVLWCMSCPVFSCLVQSCLVQSCPVLSCPFLSCLVLSCLVLSCLLLSCIVLSCLVLSCPVLSCPVFSCHVLLCPFLSSQVLPCPVLTCLIMFFFLSCRGVPAAETGRPDRCGDVHRKLQAPGANGELAWGACVCRWSESCLLLTGSVLGWTFSLSLLADAVNVVFGVLWRCLKYVVWLLRQSPHWYVVHFSVKMGSCRDRHVCLHLRGCLYLACCRCRNDRLWNLWLLRCCCCWVCCLYCCAGKCIRHHWQLMSSKSSKSCRCSRVFGIAREMPKVLAELRLFNICWVLFQKWRFVILQSIDDCYALRCLRRRFHCLTYASWPP